MIQKLLLLFCLAVCSQNFSLHAAQENPPSRSCWRRALTLPIVGLCLFTGWKIPELFLGHDHASHVCPTLVMKNCSDSCMFLEIPKCPVSLEKNPDKLIKKCPLNAHVAFNHNFGCPNNNLFPGGPKKEVDVIRQLEECIHKR